MLKIALTGGVATGKSYVLREFRRLGVPCFDADDLAHEALAAGTDGARLAAARFGNDVLAPDGSVDRKKLGPVVFGDAKARRDLEASVHPAVYHAIGEGLGALERAGAHPLAIADIPLLYETDHQDDFDRVIVTACSPETQVARIMERDRLSEGAARARLAAQWPIDQKALRAQFVIRTDGTFEETTRQVGDVFRVLSGLAAQSSR